MRLRSIGAGAGIVALALVLGWGWSLATTRVVNWFVMTDELFYERLAISIAQTSSPLPRIQGQAVDNVNQLYPILLSFVFGDANVPASLVEAHRLNAFVMASVAIPVYLLARRTDVGRLASFWAGALAAVVPWIVLSSFLLTEVVAYPAFCWALLAIAWATARRWVVADVVALVAIGVAVTARAQFFLLALVLAVAVLADALLDAAKVGERGTGVLRVAGAALLGSRKVLLAAYLVGLVVFAAAVATGDGSRLLGTYSVTTSRIRVDLDLLQLAFEHVAILALGMAIVPFVLGVGWLVDRLRPSASDVERALALTGIPTLLFLTLQVASFNQRFGEGLVKERYLFYTLPVVLVAVAASLSTRRWPAWWAFLVPAVACVIGFASVQLPIYEKLNADSPIAAWNEEILRVASSLGWAHALLIAVAVGGTALLIGAASILPRRVVAIGVAALATVMLPAGAALAFDRLFAVNGTNGLPITLDQGPVFGWVDRHIGNSGRVTMIRYPSNDADFWAGVGYWWDAEFYNESIVDYGRVGEGQPDPDPWTRDFDADTGAMLESPTTRYALFHEDDVRFRLAGTQVEFGHHAYLYEPEQPWRASFLTEGIYGDGWTRPHTPAAIRVYAGKGQTGPAKRFVTVLVRSPDYGAERPLTISSNIAREETAIPPGGTVKHVAVVCVPPDGHATIEVATPLVSDVYRDPSKAPLTGEVDRPAGVRLVSVVLADEVVSVDACSDAPVR